MKFELSRDYEKAWEQAKKKRLACWVEYIHNGEAFRDIATTGIPENTLIVSARGTMYICIPNCDFNLFRRACVENKIAFYLPIEEAIAP
jgi:hypothetical protein